MAEMEKLEVNGIIVAIPPGKKAYLLTEHPIAGRKIEPIEKVPVEERIATILRRVGAGAKEVGRVISGILAKKKSQVEEVT